MVNVVACFMKSRRDGSEGFSGLQSHPHDSIFFGNLVLFILVLKFTTKICRLEQNLYYYQSFYYPRR